MTSSLLNKTKIVIKVMKMISSSFNTIHEHRLLQRIRHVIATINLSLPMFKKQAPVIAWDQVKRLSRALWNDTTVPRGSNIRVIRFRKAAATVMILAAKSGGRWIDIHRLRWEDLHFSKVDNINFIQAKIRISKNNLTNDCPQSLTWATMANQTAPECPRATLKRWWEWCGKPTQGFIFSNVDKKPIKHTKTYYQVNTKALKLGFQPKKVPTMHSFRITMVLTLKSLGVDTDTINRFMNWRSDSMQAYYLNVRNMRQEGAPAHKLAQLSQDQFALLQNNLF